MKRAKTILILLVAVCNFNMLLAQNETIIRGRIIDKTDQTSIIGANIVEYDDQERVINGTISNVNGDFVLTLDDPSNTVKVSVIGYNSIELEKDFNTSVLIELEPSSMAIDEVTVTAKAFSNSLTNIEDRDKAGASVKVDLSTMQDAGMVSAADALQGQVSGLDIIAASGDPGSGSQLVIRGLSSMGNSRPLIVIDGIPQFQVGQNFDLSSADSEDISALVNIALQDIKSIEVLKDAASTAIYGSRGADGVLLIETRKGRMGKVQFDYQYKNSLNIQPPAIPMLNGDEYIMLQQEEWHNNNGVTEIPSEIAYARSDPNFYNYSANTDWISEITKNGRTDDHYFSLSGGGESTRFFTSFSYLDEGGTTINTGYKRFSTRVNLDYFLSRNLLFQIKFNYSNSDRQRNLSVSNRNIREMSFIKAPNMSIWEFDENGNLTGEYFNPINSYQGDGVRYYNPVAVASLGRNDVRDNNLENTFMLRYRVSDWLIFRETISFQVQASKSKQFLPYNAIGADWINPNINRSQEGNSLGTSIRTESQAAFTKPFASDKHDISGAVTWITDQSSSYWMTVQANRSSSTNIQDPSIDPSIGWIGNRPQESRMLSGLANVNYKYLDRYLVQMNLRADAHSSFGRDNRWGLFRGFFLAWRFSSEPFLRSIEWLGESKLKFSWGLSGRQPGSVYARFATYESTSNGNYITYPAIAPTKMELSQLRWESINSLDLGIELSLFKDRVYIEGGIYEKTTSDILFEDYLIPNLTGFNELQYFNGGEMLNRGWEIMADARIVKKDPWLISVNFNTSNNVNSFLELPENFNPEKSTSIGNGQYPQRVQEGEPIGSFFGFRYIGVFPSDEDAVARDGDGNVMYDGDGNPIPFRYLDVYTFKGGDPIYEDVNHDGKIDINDVVYIGDSNPDFTGGFGGRIRYKDFDVSASFHYRMGFDIINSIALQTEGMNDRNNQSKAVLSRWRYQGQDEPGMLPRAYINHPANNLGSDRYVEQGDYLRLNNIKISYNLNKRLCDKIGVRKANFAISARKLMTFTRYSGQDPEVPQDASNPFWIGVDNANTPPPKILTLTIGIGL